MPLVDGIELKVGQVLTYPKLRLVFDLRGPEQRIAYDHGRTNVVLLSDELLSWTGSGPASGECEFTGQWPASGPMALDGSNLAVVTGSPNLFLFCRRDDGWQFEGRFAYISDEFRLLVRDGKAERGLVFKLSRVDYVRADASATDGAVHPRPLGPDGPIIVSPSAFIGETDSERRRLLLEKAVGGHRALVKDLMIQFRKDPAAECVEDPASFDLLVLWSGTETQPLLVEVKTLEGDHGDRLRLAVAQLFEYAYRIKVNLGIRADLAIALDRLPNISRWFWNYLIADRAITLIWRTGPTTFGVLGDRGSALSAKCRAFVVSAG